MSAIVANTGSNNWNTNGAWVGSVQPTAADDVTIPASATVTIPGATTVQARSVTVSALGTVTQTAGTAVLNIGDATAGAGNVALSIAGTWSMSGSNGSINFISTSATQQTINTGGQSLSNIAFTGAGSSYILGADLTVITGFSHTAGTFDTGNYTQSWGVFNSTGTGTRTLTMGSSAIACSSWTLRGSNYTITANTATVTQSSSTSAFDNNSLCPSNNYNGLSLIQSGSSGIVGFNGSTASNKVTLANYTRTGTATKTNTLIIGLLGLECTGTFTVNGDSTTNRIIVSSSLLGTSSTVTAATVSCSNVDFMDITGAGAGSWNLASITGNSGDAGGNSGITFTTSSSQSYSAGGTVNWSTLTWVGSPARVPLPQDNVAISGSGTISGDMPRLGADINFTGFTGTFSATTTTYTLYGSYTAVSGMTHTLTNSTFVFGGRGTHTLTSAGKSFSTTNFNAPGGSYTLQDAFTATSNYTLNAGSFITGSFNVTSATVTNSSGITRSITGGTTVWSLTATGAGTIWNSVITGLTMTIDAMTITLSGAASGTRTFVAGAFKYGTFNSVVNGSTGALNLSSNGAYFDTFNFTDTTNARTLALVASTLTYIKTMNINGTSGKLMSVISQTAGTPAFIDNVGAVSTVDYLSVKDIFASIPYKFYAGANSTNVSGNTNVAFTAPVTQPYIFQQAPSNIVGAVTTNTATFAFSSPATAGNLLVAIITSNNPLGAVTTPTGYTLIDTINNSSTGYSYTYYKVATGGETAVTFTYASSVASTAKLYEVAGFSGTPTLDVSDKNNNGGASATSQSTGSGVTNTYNPAYAIAVWSGSNTLGANVSITDSYQESRPATIDGSARFFAKPLSSLASQTTTLTWTTTRFVGSQLIVFGGVSASTTTNTLLMMGMGT